MAAYLYIELDVTDSASYKEYSKLVLPTIEHFGGKVLVAGEQIEGIEGNWQPKRVVILQFESIEQARGWYHSDEYEPLKQMRFKAATSRGGFVQGIESSSRH